MFQTDLHIWLQQFDNEWLVKFFQGVTALGYIFFFIVALIVIIFGINFRKGFILLLVILWTSMVTVVLKDTFELPRPYMVNSEVRLLDGAVGTDMKLINGGAATHFWALLPSETTNYFKGKSIPYGFPSGHTSLAVAFWATLALLFRKQWLSILAGCLILLIPLSRIYLGVHFLADVLGGYCIGFGMLWAFYQLVITPERLAVFMSMNQTKFELDVKHFLLLIAPILWIFLIKEVDYWIVPAVLLGFGSGFVLLAQQRLPSETGSILHRIGRVVTAFLLFGGLDFFIKQLFGVLHVVNYPFFIFLRNSLTTFILIWVGTLLHDKWKWRL